MLERGRNRMGILLVNYAPASFLNFQAGYGHFFVGDYIRESVELVPANGRAVYADFVFLMTRLNF